MQRGTVLLAAALVSAFLAASPAARTTAADAPVIVGATPQVDPTDRPGGGFFRVTFSPDGNGLNDRVGVRVRAPQGEALVLIVHPESSANADFHASTGQATAGITTLSWDGLLPDETPRPDGSYILRACAAPSGPCASTTVLAHLRLLSVYTPRLDGADAGSAIPVVIASDRPGPYTIDLARAYDPTGSGVGAATVPGAGTFSYRVPDVEGGLWILRVTSGGVVTHYPLIVHSSLSLDDPPPRTALVVFPYMTWRAYDRSDLNRDGQIDSWYAHPRDPVVPLRGPFENFRNEPARSGREADPLEQESFAAWLREHPARAQYVSDIELGSFPLDVLRRYALIVFPGHTEYYQQQTFNRLLAYRDGGGHLYFMTGNPFYGDVAVGRTTITRLSYRYRTTTRSDFGLAATGFVTCCWPRTISPRYHLAAGVVSRLPWLFRGTGFKAGDEFGLALGEVDAVDRKLSPPGTIVIASATVPAFPGTRRAVGWIGTRPFRYPRPSNHSVRVVVAYARTGRGEVFSWGDTDFVPSLYSAAVPSAERTGLRQAAFNVWEHFAQ